MEGKRIRWACERSKIVLSEYRMSALAQTIEVAAHLPLNDATSRRCNGVDQTRRRRMAAAAST